MYLKILKLKLKFTAACCINDAYTLDDAGPENKKKMNENKLRLSEHRQEKKNAVSLLKCCFVFDNEHQITHCCFSLSVWLLKINRVNKTASACVRMNHK